MAIFKKSENDVHGFVPYSIGLAAIIVTCTCVAGASVLSQVAQNGKGPVFAFLAPKSVPDTTTVTAQKKPVARIDYGATASIGDGRTTNFLQQPIILDPCTGREK